MKLRESIFRILLPSLYVVVALLPIVGIIITIAEGPNPFGFLLPASAPGFLLTDFIEHRLVRLPVLNFWLEMLFVMLLNIGFYFLVGWALDAMINRYRKRH